MKKEVIIAIIIGVAIGLVVTYGIHTAKSALNHPLENPQPSPSSANPSVQETNEHQLQLGSPQDYAIVPDDKLNVSGTTTPHSLIAIIGSADQNTALADAQGNFVASLSLQPGANLITVVSYAQSGNEAKTELIVVQSAANLDTQSPEPTPAELTPTSKAN